MRLSASRSCLVAGTKPRRVLPRAGAITSRFESLEKLWRRRDERTSFGPSRRDSNPCFSLERVSPWVVISLTSLTGATVRCHSAGSSAAGAAGPPGNREVPRRSRAFRGGFPRWISLGFVGPAWTSAGQSTGQVLKPPPPQPPALTIAPAERRPRSPSFRHLFLIVS